MDGLPAIPVVPFRWRDGERLIVFGRGGLAEAGELAGAEYALLTTPRALVAAPELAERASAVHEVAAGRVDEVGGSLLEAVRAETLVALGGGRVIDVAKALAAANPPCRVVAIPTTLSGAEMTPIHRRAAGASQSSPGVRPAVVVNDPALSASQPVDELARSAANALGHAIEGPITRLANPVATLAGLQAARLIASGFNDSAIEDDDRDALALGALLGGYVIGSTGYSVHHVVSQTLARFAGVAHGAANAIMLPESIRALRDRAPAWYCAAFADALGSEPAEFAARLRDLGGVPNLRDAGVSEDQLDRCATEASKRPELEMTPPPVSAEEIRGMYAAAYC